ncbi:MULTISPECIES: zinc ribbon domain-containing protein [Geobacillus]
MKACFGGGQAFLGRIFRCDACGLEMDRDRNASINLSRYPA